MLYLSKSFSRRDALRFVSTGLTGLAFASLSSQANSAAARSQPGLTALQQGVLIAGHVVDRTLWVSDNRGHLYSSDDGGENWRVLGPQAAGALTAITVGRKLGVAVGHRGAVLISSDRGQKWSASHLPSTDPISLLDVLVLPSGRIIAVGAFGAYWQSDDVGKSWQSIQPITGDKHYNASAHDLHGAIVIVGEAGLILRSTDEGVTWSEVESPVKSSLFSIVSTSAGRFVACGLGGAVLHSVDGGNKWQVSPTPEKHSWFGVSAMAEDVVLLAGNGGALCSLTLNSSGGATMGRHTREGYGTWSRVLPWRQPNGAGEYLMAVGETGLKRVNRAAWSQSEGAAL